MLEKLIIAGSIALVMGTSTLYYTYKKASTPKYQERLVKLEQDLEIVKLTETDPAKRFVKSSKIESKIIKLKDKIKSKKIEDSLEVLFENKRNLQKLKRRQVQF